MRRDVHVYNESTGFVITSEGLAADRRADDVELGSPGSRAWSRAVQDGRLLPVELVQDDPFVVRVVVDEDLTEEEEEERVGRLEARLELPDGRLALTGGSELLEEGREAARGYTQVLKVAPGSYRLTLDAHLPGVNGEQLRRQALGRKREAVGAYFRRTRPKKRFPAWLQAWCAASPGDDPGHEEAWSDVEVGERAMVAFVVHLTKLGRKKVASPKVGSAGWVGLKEWDVRLPAACPIGLAARRPLPPKEPRPGQRVTWQVDLPDVVSHLDGRELAPLEGGPVEVDVEALGRVFLLAWFATDASHPEVRLQLPAPGALKVEVEGVVAQREGAVVRLVAPRSTLRWEALDRARAVGAALAKAAPDGSTLELLTSCPDLGVPGATPEGEEGRQRYRGTIDRGRWRVDATYPPLGADVLREALALAADAEGGRALELRDAEEARRVHARAMGEDASLFDRNPLEVAGASLRLREPHPRHLIMVAQHAFRARYAGAWAVPPEPAGDPGDARGAGDVVLEGALGAWTRADLDASTGVADVEAGMQALGFTRLGDLTRPRAVDLVVRGYALPGGHTWGVLLVGPSGQGGLELVTEFEGGALVVTTTAPDEVGVPAPDDLRQRQPRETPPLKLLFQHRKLVAAHAPRLGATRTVQAELRALAALLDAALARA